MDNPHAQFRKEVDLETVLESPVVADPLRLYDFCPITDGSAGLVFCPESVAQEYTDDYVVVSGVGGATDTHVVHEREDPTTMGGVVESSNVAYEMADRGPEDVDVADALLDVETAPDVTAAPGEHPELDALEDRTEAPALDDGSATPEIDDGPDTPEIDGESETPALDPGPDESAAKAADDGITGRSADDDPPANGELGIEDLLEGPSGDEGMETLGSDGDGEADGDGDIDRDVDDGTDDGTDDTDDDGTDDTDDDGTDDTDDTDAESAEQDEDGAWDFGDVRQVDSDGEGDESDADEDESTETDR